MNEKDLENAVRLTSMFVKEQNYVLAGRMREIEKEIRRIINNKYSEEILSNIKKETY